jgi:hypothetical protein
MRWVEDHKKKREGKANNTKDSNDFQSHNSCIN